MAKSHIEIAKQLKQNSAEIREYFEDLYKWQDELKEQEKKEKSFETKKEKNKFVEKAETGNKYVDSLNKNVFKKKKENNLLKRDCNSLDTYYGAWDKLNVEDINEENEKQEENAETNNTISYKQKSVEAKIEPIKEKQIDDVDYEIKGSQTVEKQQNYSLLSNYPKVYEIYISKNEENKKYFQNKSYNECLECCNDIINYIDYELGNNNIFLEIEKNWENELCIDIISSNFLFDKKTEELFIIRTKCLINRSLIYQKLFSFYESIQDCSSVILFYKYFLPNKENCTKYIIRNLFTVNIKYTIFKAYYLRGTARYKLKIYKCSLNDFKKSKELLAEEKTCFNLDNVNKSIQIVENIINDNKVKKHLRRQNEYTATLMEQFKLKPRLLNIEVVPRKQLKQLISGDTLSESNKITETKKEIKMEKDMQTEKEMKMEKDMKTKKEMNMVNKITTEKENAKEKKTTTGKEKEKSVTKEKEEKAISNDYINIESDSSLTISGDSILTDIEETKPILLINPNKKQNGLIKNKINFELLWNSNKIKKNYKEQINLLKTAFLDEGIFHFSSDKDMYVDILDSLFKNKFLNMFEKNSPVEWAKIVLEKCEQNPSKEPETTEKEETGVNILTADDCIHIIDIIYCMTNFGKDRFVFLFINNNEKTAFANFFNFVLNYSKKFSCNENYIKHKTSLMKKLLQIED